MVKNFRPVLILIEVGDGLKLDSMGRIELLSALEDKYQIEIDEAAFTEATTSVMLKILFVGK